VPALAESEAIAKLRAHHPYARVISIGLK
jgi:hypothetical protein